MSKSRQNSNVPNRLSVADRTELLTKTGTREGEVILQRDIGLLYAWTDTQGTDNGGTILNVSTGSWLAQYDGAVNVTWFGVVDSDSDTYATLNNTNFELAKTFCLAQDAVLFIPAGTFVLTGDINITGLSILGEGQKEAIIKLSGSNTNSILFRNNFSTWAEDTGWGQGGGGITLRNLTLKGNWDGSSDQTVITPPSGAGNGLVGLRFADYNETDNKAVLQLISSTRNIIDNITVTRGYQHNIILTRGAYGTITNCSVNECRGSGIYSPNASNSSSVTSYPITDCKFETCRGEYGAIYADNWAGTQINTNVFEGQPYGIYFNDACTEINFDGNYAELHYYEDYHIPSTSWGMSSNTNYSFNIEKPTGGYKGLFHYSGHTGLYISTDTIAGGSYDANINEHYFQYQYYSFGGIQTISDTKFETGNYFNLQLSTPGGASLDWYSVIRHQHNPDSLFGAAEIRFKRNLNQNTWSGLGFACGRGALVEYLSIGDTGHTTPGTDNTQTLGSATNRWSVVYAGTGTINTSDDREKTYLTIEQIEKNVALELKSNMRKFKFNEAIDKKGDKARIHFGASAQTVKTIFENNGLNGFDYAVLCHDEWYEYNGQAVEVDENFQYVSVHYELDGETVSPNQDGVYPDGAIEIVDKYDTVKKDRYGIRYEELLCFIMSAI